MIFDIYDYATSVENISTARGTTMLYYGCLFQGLKQTEMVYQLTPFTTFLGNFAALTLTVYSAQSFFMSRFQDSRVDALLLKELYRQNAENFDDQETENDIQIQATKTSPKNSQKSSDSQSDDENKTMSKAPPDKTTSNDEARQAFKERVEGSQNFDLRFLSSAYDAIIVFLY